ncbi:ATP-binding protein [Psychrobacter sp. AOP22-C1-22]|uniref:GAF domain-containing hybrid sensor histidine kinase/response regulator n=1 Tax=unclassified Psychrobacter TaxID=196806 RepID=UPI001CE49B84|nr:MULTISPECIES: GAF domain-containing hybrid sensor histidine kinase/response regulator [unclassified Psychrobacter]MDN5891094.1 ATP-binding protein [Psychrobacter sp.]
MSISNPPQSSYPVAVDEAERITKLKKYQVLNDNDEPAFKRLVDLAKLFFDMPIVTITFMDEETQYLKSIHGLGDVCRTTREVAICNYTVLSNDVFVVEDLSKDSRFSQNPLVTESPYLRFYAGAPIIIHEGNKSFRLGSLCVMDMKPKYDFDEQQAKILAQFATMAADALQLQDKQRDAKLANEMKSDFLANMSHEIRTPMNGIIGMVDMLGETKLSSEQQEYIDNIKVSNEHLMAIINGILDLSKVESGKMSIDFIPVNLSALCNEVVSLFTAKARQRGLILDYHYTESLSPYIEGDPVRLKQIIANLVNNAIKFTREGGRVSIDVKHVPNCHCDEVDERRTKKRNNTKNGQAAADNPIDSNTVYYEDMTLCIEVTDSGVGIKPESLEAIFEAYDQADKFTHRLYGGTGLGLSVCKSLVDLMGGYINVDSEVGVGTTFSVLLPLPAIDENKYETWQDSNDFTMIDPTHELAGHILLVEDDAVNAIIAKKALTNSGHTVTHVTDGQQAIETFSLSPERYDVILMDHHMPILDGVQATIKLHEIYDPKELPPIIALTANAMDGEREKYLKVGMQDYCTKPFTQEQLNALVQYWLMHKQILVEE